MNKKKKKKLHTHTHRGRTERLRTEERKEASKQSSSPPNSVDPAVVARLLSRGRHEAHGRTASQRRLTLISNESRASHRYRQHPSHRWRDRLSGVTVPGPGPGSVM